MVTLCSHQHYIVLHCGFSITFLMFSIFPIDFATILAAQIEATFSLLTAHIAIRSLHILTSRGSVWSIIYSCKFELLYRDIYVAFILYLSMPTLLRPGCYLVTYPASTLLAYFFFVSSTQYLTDLAQDDCKVRFGTESRLITRIRSAKTYLSWIILGVAICSYIFQRYSGVNQQYSADMILLWGIAGISWYHPIMIIAAKYSYRGMEPIDLSEQPISNRVASISKCLTMFIACEIHGILLLLYPPASLLDMHGFLEVGFVIGAAYFKVAPPDSPIFREPTRKHPTSEKLPLTSAGW